jgi:hypothetical protein
MADGGRLIPREATARYTRKEWISSNGRWREAVKKQSEDTAV